MTPYMLVITLDCYLRAVYALDAVVTQYAAAQKQGPNTSSSAGNGGQQPQQQQQSLSQIPRSVLNPLHALFNQSRRPMGASAVAYVVHLCGGAYYVGQPCHARRPIGIRALRSGRAVASPVPTSVLTPLRARGCDYIAFVVVPVFWSAEGRLLAAAGAFPPLIFGFTHVHMRPHTRAHGPHLKPRRSLATRRAGVRHLAVAAGFKGTDREQERAHVRVQRDGGGVLRRAPHECSAGERCVAGVFVGQSFRVPWISFWLRGYFVPYSIESEHGVPKPDPAWYCRVHLDELPRQLSLVFIFICCRLCRADARATAGRVRRGVPRKQRARHCARGQERHAQAERCFLWTYAPSSLPVSPSPVFLLLYFFVSLRPQERRTPAVRCFL